MSRPDTSATGTGVIHFGSSTRHAVPLSADAKWIEPWCGAPARMRAGATVGRVSRRRLVAQRVSAFVAVLCWLLLCAYSGSLYHNGQYWGIYVGAALVGGSLGLGLLVVRAIRPRIPGPSRVALVAVALLGWAVFVGLGPVYLHLTGEPTPVVVTDTWRGSETERYRLSRSDTGADLGWQYRHDIGVRRDGDQLTMWVDQKGWYGPLPADRSTGRWAMTVAMSGILVAVATTVSGYLLDRWTVSRRFVARLVGGSGHPVADG
ncbi:hypothetical protein EDC02_3236 [Micromonospora sp. Llam0]|uniref:hypothetical protein n=1 Tax=Micromonospora sp. Llam0 TaxID=2485143 RepID=UPI000F4AA073|nr:hypothetical protein [Micromonospora sp. Llam0]ROO61303.1 hypothetical protein EDC02_3236 [Micromonospora sp. Llam0]